MPSQCNTFAEMLSDSRDRSEARIGVAATGDTAARLSPFDQRFNFSVCLLAIVCTCAVYGATLWHSMDIPTADEAVYLGMALRLKDWSTLPMDWGPLYSSWYSLLLFFSRDALDAYRLNSVLLVGIQAILVYLVIFEATSCAAYTYLITLLLLNANMWLIWPRIYGFQLCLLLFFVLLAVRAHRVSSSALVMALFTLWSSFVRPEMLVLSLIYFTSYLFLSRANPAPERKSVIFFGVLYITTLVSIFVTLDVVGYGLSPMSCELNAGGSRLWNAFWQHVAIRYVVFCNMDVDASLAFYVTMSSLGEGVNVITLLSDHPRLFFYHMLCNLRDLPAGLFKALVPVSFMPKVHVAGVISLLALIVHLMTRGKAFRDRPSALKRNWDTRVLLLAPVAMVYLALSVIIYPRTSYLFLVLVPLVIMICVSLGSVRLIHRKSCVVVLAVLGVLIWTPSSPVATSGTNARFLNVLRSIGPPEPLNFIDGSGGLGLLANRQWRLVNCSRLRNGKPVRFLDLLEAEDIQCVLGIPSLSTWYGFTKDAGWEEFLRNPSRFGFSRYDTHTNYGPVFLRNSESLPSRADP